MKRNERAFDEYVEKLTELQAKRLHKFWEEYEVHCLLTSRDKKNMADDFEQAILWYAENGRTLEEALSLLDVKYLGGFYSRGSSLWFPLDDAAKVYPLMMEHGKMSVYRMSMYLKEEVVPELLQMALTFTIKRFPSFATTLKKGFFWHYLDTTKRRFFVQPEQDIPCLPIPVYRSGSQTFRVLYHKNRISVEFFHALTDGTGSSVFLKSLVGEYLRLKGVSMPKDGLLWDIQETPSAEEFENAFAKVPLSGQGSGFVDKAAVQMGGKLTEIKPCRILHFNMDALQLKEVASRYGTTVTVYLLALMFLAGNAATDLLKGEMSIQVPVNMRKYYPSRTVRNFSMYCGIRMPMEEIRNVEELIPVIADQLQQKASKENMSEMLTATVKLVSTLKFIPLFMKEPIVNLVQGFFGDRIFTNTLTNLGVVKMPEEAMEHIKSMDIVLGSADTNRAGCSMVTFGKVATFTITKTSADPSFEEKMYELLEKDGLEVSVEGSGYYAH